MSIPKPDSLPDHLSAIWDEMEPRVRVVIGPAGMEALCAQIYRMRDAQERVTKDGIVVADTKGNPCPHPALAIEKQAQSEVRAWVQKFGGRPM